VIDLDRLIDIIDPIYNVGLEHLSIDLYCTLRVLRVCVLACGRMCVSVRLLRVHYMIVMSCHIETTCELFSLIMSVNQWFISYSSQRLD